MVQQVFSVNRDAIRKAAEQARGREMEHGGDIKWYAFKPGENIIRLCPPYSAKGLIVKEVGVHYNVGEESCRCLTLSHSLDNPNIQCPVCNVLVALSQQFPHIDLSTYAPKRKGYAWIIDQMKPEDGPQIARLPSAIADWINVQLDKPEYDIANPAGGVDICITKTGKGSWKNTRYEKTLTPARTPLAKTPEILSAWLTAIKDLDIIFKCPEGEDFDAIIGVASNLRKVLTLKTEGEMRAQYHQGTVGVALPPPPPPVSGGGYPAAPISSAVVVPPPVGYPSVPIPLPVMMPPNLVTVPVTNPVTIPPPNLVMPPANPPAISNLPECYGGAVAHADGSKGYQPNVEKCQACPKEFECVNAVINS